MTIERAIEIASWEARRFRFMADLSAAEAKETGGAMAAERAIAQKQAAEALDVLIANATAGRSMTP